MGAPLYFGSSGTPEIGAVYVYGNEVEVSVCIQTVNVYKCACACPSGEEDESREKKEEKTPVSSSKALFRFSSPIGFFTE